MSAPSTSTSTQQQPLAPPHVGDAQCPVPHAAAQPLPPGHPPVPSAPSSSLKAPSDPRCIFFRTHEGTASAASTPPLSRQSSVIRAAELQRANINPLKDGEGAVLDPNTSLVLASRSSQLALVQSSQVSAMLSSHYGAQSPAFESESHSASLSDPALALTPQERNNLDGRLERLGITKSMSFPITSMSTAGDLNSRSPLYVIGGEGKAIWTKELEVALAAGGVDALVHCLKDIPTTLPDNFTLAAILEREDPRDALVVKQGLPYVTLDELPPGSVIGTSSVRRVAQLRRRYPSLVFSDVRGNLNTRLAKLDSPTGPYTALVLAAAGLIRIDLGHRITAYLSRPVLLYSVGQGSLAIEVRKPPPGADPATNRDARILEIVKSIGDWRATARAEAERALLKELEGGCSIPVGVETRFEDHDAVEGVRNETAETAAEQDQDGHTVTRLAAEKAGAATAAASSNGNGESSSSAAEGSAAATRPDTLSRLATGTAPTGSDAFGIQAAPSAPAAASNNAAWTDSATINALLKPCRAEDRSLPPASPIRLYLTAIVVSLDGTRSCENTSSALISDLEDARRLGVQVAQELAERKGARVILEEVERHRRLAEAADEKRKAAEREKREAERDLKKRRLDDEAAQHPEGQPGVNGHDHRIGTASADEDDAATRQRLEKALEAARANGNGASAPEEEISLHPQAGGEVDRRGVPRSDGQPKAWEV